MLAQNEKMNRFNRALDQFQTILNFGNCKSQQFQGNGLGKIGTTGFMIGILGGLHLGYFLTSSLFLYLLPNEAFSESTFTFIFHLNHWSLYFSLLCLFHFGEFFVTAVHQPTVLSYDSYIVNHSKNYTLAAIASWIEYWLECYLFGRRKHEYVLVLFIGLCLVLGGQVLRSLAMWTCGTHFSHQIMTERRKGHVLVTHGVYSLLRHPSYTGWFWWSVGTQLLLLNPLCLLGYSAASLLFFRSRIPFEEESLVQFYGQEYREYARRTVVGIPFIPSL